MDLVDRRNLGQHFLTHLINDLLDTARFEAGEYFVNDLAHPPGNCAAAESALGLV